MFTKEFFKTIYNRYTCTGIVVMGIFNAVLLYLRFRHMIAALPATMTLLAIDVSLVLCLTLLGILVECIRAAAGRKNRGAGKTDTGNQQH